MNQSPKKPNPTPSSIPLNDPRYPIWGRLFQCRVPRIATFSTFYLERYGLHTSGNEAVDRELARAPVFVYITINDMVEFYHTSQPISIVKQADVKMVYEICQDYTFNYAERIAKTVFTHDVPFADLIKIDEFAEAVYQYAGHEYGSDFARTFLPKNVMKEAVDLNKMFEAIDNKVKNKGKIKEDHYTVHTEFSPQGMRRAAEEQKRSSEDDREKLPERPSMRDLFLSYMDNTGIGGRL